MQEEFIMTTKPLSQTLTAIASRKRRADVAAAKKKTAGDPPAANPPIGEQQRGGTPPLDQHIVEPSTATIGVTSPEKPAGKAAELFHCSNCDADVSIKPPECPTCGQIFNWPKGE